MNPKSHSTGPSSPFRAMAFNASAVYRAACIRKVSDYSRYLPLAVYLSAGRLVAAYPVPYSFVQCCSYC